MMGMLVTGEKDNLTDIMIKVNDFIRDTDDPDSKTKMKSLLKSASDACSIVVLGETGVGKSTVINAIFEGKLASTEACAPTVTIIDIRYGAQDAHVQVDDLLQRKFINDEAFKGVSVIDTPGIGKLTPPFNERLRGLIEDASLICVVLSSEDVQSFSTWDYINDMGIKKALFVLSKHDEKDGNAVSEQLRKIEGYAKDADISATAFAVGVPEEIRRFIRENHIGEDVYLSSQESNLIELKSFISSLENSFEKRFQQYQADIDIVKQIDGSMDSFRSKHDDNVKHLMNELAETISAEIDNYRDEIIRRLDPKTIRERFPGGKNDFSAWLSMVNDNYKNLMMKAVDRKTQRTIRTFLGDLDMLFEETAGYLSGRETILDVDDKLYGTLAVSRNSICTENRQLLTETAPYYKSLTDVSEELFMEAWSVRRVHDIKKCSGGVVGGVAGGSAAAIVLLAVAKGAATGATVGSAAPGPGTVIGSAIGAIIGACLGAYALYHIVENFDSPSLDKKMQEYIEKFKLEIENIKSDMTGQLTEAVTAMFNNELNFLDKSFLELRTSTNIDHQRLPIMAEQLKELKQAFSGYYLQ